MWDKLKDANRLNEFLFMGTLSLFCFAFSVTRAVCSGTKAFLFLNWNLFLAFIPWALTTGLLMHPKVRESKIILALTTCLWLLFFPNAPYILTDLFHLYPRPGIPVWLDLVLILSFAWSGLLFGFLSLFDIEEILSKHMHPKIVSALAIILLFISAFGIYLGRFLRWNSWDILTNPLGLASDIGERLIDPLDHPRTWGVTLFMGLLLNILYFSLKLINRRKMT